MEIKVKKIKKASLFKILFIGNNLGLFLFFLICGIASIFGANTINLNDKPITGPMGLVAAMIMWPIFSTILCCMQWIAFSFGLWIFSFFKPLELSFVDEKIIQDTEPHLPTETIEQD